MKWQILVIILDLLSMTSSYMVHRLQSTMKDIGFLDHRKSHTWEEGNEKCRQLNFDGLFCVTSQEESEQFVAIMKRIKVPSATNVTSQRTRHQQQQQRSWGGLDGSRYWQGVSRTNDDVMWEYAVSDDDVTYQPWSTDDDSDDVGDCVAMTYRCEEEGDCDVTWSKEDCEMKIPIICERIKHRQQHSKDKPKENHETPTKKKYENPTKENYDKNSTLEIETRKLFDKLNKMTSQADDVTDDVNNFHHLSHLAIHEETTDVSQMTFELALEIAQDLYEKLEPAEDGDTMIKVDDVTEHSRKITQTLEVLLSRVAVNSTMTLSNFTTKSLHAQVRYVINTSDDVRYEEGNTEIVVPGEAVMQGGNDVTRVSFIKYNSSTFFPSPYNAVGIIAAQVNHQPIRNLQAPVTYTIQLPPKSSNNEIRFLQCAAWDYEQLSWSTEGCWMLESHDQQPICRCNHLTNFALLVQFHHRPVKATILFKRIFAILGSISCFGFFATAAIFFSYRELRHSPPGPLHIHLCLCLLCGFLTMMIGSDKTDKKMECVVIAALTHYFMLAGWMWMLAHGISMYKLLVRKHQSLDEYFLRYATILAYLIPAIVVGITIGVTVGYYDHQELVEHWTRYDVDEVYESHYVSNSFCWLRGNALYFGYFTLQGVIAATNILICLLVVRSITWGRRKIQHSTKKRMKPMQQVCVIFTITFLLGMVWIIAIPLDLLGDIPFFTEAISYVVSTLISIQGVVMFYLFCIRNRMARKLWATSVARQIVRLPCCGNGLEQCWMFLSQVRTRELRYRRRSSRCSYSSKSSFRTPLPSTDSVTSGSGSEMKKTVNKMVKVASRGNKISHLAPSPIPRHLTPSPTPSPTPRLSCPMVDLHLSKRPISEVFHTTTTSPTFTNI